MNGTAHSAKRATERRPPKMITAVSSTSPMAICARLKPNASPSASAMALACTLLKTRP